jgi:hypothetical protein
MAKVKKVKKYQNSGKPLEYTYPGGNKVAVDTSGFAAGAKRFPMTITTSYKKPSGPSFGGPLTSGTVATNRKGAQRMIDVTQGKKKKPLPIKRTGLKKVEEQRTGGKVTTAKTGKQMIKRADGSVSQRGLWDNIRANKGSGKKPTAAMLKQEKKIKAKSK